MGGLVSSKGIKRLGLAVTKSVGNAVKRNAVKRRFRVLARKYENTLPSGCCVDVVMRAKPCAYSADFQDLDYQVEKLFTKISGIYGESRKNSNTSIAMSNSSSDSPKDKR